MTLLFARAIFVAFPFFAVSPQESSSPAEPEPEVVAPTSDAAQAEDEESSTKPQALDLPTSTEEALQMRRGLDALLEGHSLEEIEELYAAWIVLVRGQASQLEAALSAPEGSPEHESLNQVRTDLDTLLAGADAIVEAMAEAGGQVEAARDQVEALRPDDRETLEGSTVPPNRQAALDLPVEVLKSQLRPLTQEQVSAQLDQWVDFLQRTCIEVRNVEVSALQTEDSGQVADLNARAVALRGERGSLIKRVNAVINALERKGGDVDAARAYVQSVVAEPPITGWRAAWATARAWLVDKEGGIDVAKRAGKAVAILLAFWFLSKALTKVARRATRSLPRASELLREFITTSVGRLTLLIGVIVALATLGINMTPLVAAIGAAGLVIGLALQGTLSNLASGLMIMIYRPFDIGDAVSVAGVTGKIHGMTLMTTSVKTFDNQAIHIPNNRIWGDVITNITANATRRVDMVFGISYADDVERAKGVLKGILDGHDKVLDDPAPVIRLHELADSSVNLIVRPWTKTADYWDVYWDVTEEVKRTFDREDISIPFPQRDVHLIPVPGAPSTADAPKPAGGELQPTRPRG